MKANAVFHIGEGMIKFLQVSSGSKKTVTAVDVLNIEKQNDQEISQALIAFVKKKKINLKDCRVTVLVPRSRVILRHMVFPSQNEAEIRSMIDLQVGSRIPYVREEVEIDFQVLSKSADGYSKVAVVIIPQDIAMRYWDIFSRAKITVHRMTISSIGLWLLYQQQKPNLSEKPGAIFDLDINHSEICVCYKAHWLTSREIPIGFEQMQKDGYETILKQWELTQNDPTRDKIMGTVDSVFLVSTANRAYALGIEMGKLEGTLTVKEILLPQILPLAKGVKWPELMLEEGASVASLAGIALSNEIPPIDLVPTAVRKEQEKQVHQKQIILGGLWAVVALISLGMALGMGFFRKNLELSKLDTTLGDAKHQAFGVEKEVKKINDIESIIRTRLIFSNLASIVYRLLPPQIYLVNIVISDNNTLSFEGVATNSLSINQFQQDMVHTKSFSNVNLDYVNKRVVQDGEVDYFKITCTFNSASSS